MFYPPNYPNRLSTKCGYTFIEAMITMTIFSVMIGCIYSTFVLSQRAWMNYSENIIPRQEVRRALISMTDELREAKNPFLVSDAHSLELNFERPSLGQVSYKWTDEGENRGKIIRTNYTKETILAYHIASLTFTNPTDRELIIEVSAGGKDKFSLKEKIALRAKTGLVAQGENEKIK